MAGAAHQLDRHDAVAAEVEEVVVDADAIEEQQFRENDAEDFFGRSPRAALYGAERTPAAAFGLSHFVVLRKRSATA